MPDTPISVFISYAHEESDFVNRLEADLQARMFNTWVDRHQLKGGQDWLEEIQDAIEKRDVLLVVLSPHAVNSRYVRMEYRHALREGKLVIPLNYKPCEKVPIDLNHILWVNFQGEGKYDQGLNDVLIALSNIEIKTPVVPDPVIVCPVDEEAMLVAPQPALPEPSPELDDLYRRGVKAQAENNLELASVFWQQIMDRDRHFRNDTLIPWFEKLEKELHPIRVERLRGRAEAAQTEGKWGQAIGAWDALLKFEPEDWQAKESIRIARHNQEHAYYYEDAAHFVSKGDIPAAKKQLEMLWHDAPSYGDPLALGKSVKVHAPSSYWKRREKDARYHFAVTIDRALPRLIMLYIFCLLTGVGVTIGVLTQSWMLACTGIAVATLFAYLLGYRKVITPTAILGHACISCIVALGSIYAISVIDASLLATSAKKEIVTWLLFALTWTLIFGLPLIVPAYRIIWKMNGSNVEVNKFSEGYLIILCIVFVVIFLTAIWWGGLLQASFDGSFSWLGVALGIMDGVGLEAFLLIWWNALVRFRSKLS